uniref:CUB domain-containing protein n=1 Tax=Romanomermis culicivorax TaxID=13658 RepID=A0A915L373_ROMCU
MPIRPKDNPCLYPNPDHPTVRLMLNNRTLPIGSHYLFNGSMKFQIICSPRPGSHSRLEVCQLWSWQNRTRCKSVKCSDFVRVWRHKNDTPVLYRFEVTIFAGKNIYRNIESYAYIYLIYVPKPRTNLVIYRRGSSPDRLFFHMNSTVIVEKHPKVVSYACRAKVRFRTCNPFVDHFSKLAIIYLDTDAAPATLPNYNTTTTRQRLFHRTTTTTRFYMGDEEYYDVADDPRVKGKSMTTIIVSSVVGGVALVALIIGGGVFIMKRMNKRQKDERTARKLSRKLRSQSKKMKKAVTFLDDDKSKSRQSIKSIQTSQKSGRSSKKAVDSRKSNTRSLSRTFNIGPPLSARPAERLSHRKSMGRLSKRKSMGSSLKRTSLGPLINKKSVRPSLGKKSAASPTRKKP